MTYAPNGATLRFIALALAGTLTVAAIPANAMDRDLTDQVPNWISEASFNSMDAYDIHDIDHAQNLGKRVVIEGYTVAGSRDLVDERLNLGTVAQQSTSFEPRRFGPLDRQAADHNR